jgi:predicted RNA binding protein YcfA (HicA-like mRNA interferase family)
MLKNVKAKDLMKVLESVGFKVVRITGSHHRLIHKDGRKTSVPVHGSEPIGSGLLNKIIKKDVGLSKEEFEELLKNLLVL